MVWAANFSTSEVEDCVFEPQTIKSIRPCGGNADISMSYSGGVFTIHVDDGEFTVALADIEDCCSFNVPATVVTWPSWDCDFGSAYARFVSFCIDPMPDEWGWAFSASGIANFPDRCACPEDCGALNGGPKALATYDGTAGRAEWPQNPLVKPCYYAVAFGDYGWARWSGQVGQDIIGESTIWLKWDQNYQGQHRWYGTATCPASWNPSLLNPAERAYQYFRLYPIALTYEGIVEGEATGYRCDMDNSTLWAYPTDIWDTTYQGGDGYDSEFCQNVQSNYMGFCVANDRWRSVTVSVTEDWINKGGNGSFNYIWLPAGDYIIPGTENGACITNQLRDIPTAYGNIDIHLQFSDPNSFPGDPDLTDRWWMSVWNDNPSYQFGEATTMYAKSVDLSTTPRCPDEAGIKCDEFVGPDTVEVYSPVWTPLGQATLEY